MKVPEEVVEIIKERRRALGREARRLLDEIVAGAAAGVPPGEEPDIPSIVEKRP